MKNIDSKTTMLRYVFYTLLTCVLCVGCYEEELIKNDNMKKQNSINSIGIVELENVQQNRDTMIGYRSLKTNGDMPILPIGMREKNINYKLDECQIQFIKQCKIAGKTGCSITIDNQQVYVSFYENARDGNAR